MRITCEKHTDIRLLICKNGTVSKAGPIENSSFPAIRRLLAGERHETVQPFVLLSLWPEHFNLDAISESLPNAQKR
jgi:hypothetical protein